jgi:PPK2 family polyphosphate:nucleotide phosphotransferase
MAYAHKLDKQAKINLADFDAGDTRGVVEAAGRAEAVGLGTELGELQELLYAAGTHAVLIVLQGMDTSGKDGTISHVFDSVNPQSVSVASFKVPTSLEQSHDFLWRIHQKTPPKGMMTIFNRSHYEDVLVVRVHELITEKVWKQRYEEINQFEAMLAASNTIILKFFLHITKEEQEKRLLAREQDVTKGWKLSAGDWQERRLWDKYIDAYEDALGKTASETAPWYIVPANHKWYRNVAVAEALVHTLRPYKKQWDERLEEISRAARAELSAMRAEQPHPKNGSSKTGGRQI